MFARVFNFTHFGWKNLSVWCLMAFQAGVINTGGFIGCHRFVSHTTGFATAFGEAFAGAQWNLALSAAGVPLFFLAGVMISAYFVDRRVALGQTPQYTLLISIIVFLMAIAVFGGRWGWFGAFNPEASLEPNFALLAILCLACGIQNASITSASGATVRTTHLTGITTDLGIGLMRLASKGQSEKVIEYEKKASIMRIGIITSFIAGSVVGTLLFLRYEYFGYLLPLGISGTLLIIDLRERLR